MNVGIGSDGQSSAKWLGLVRVLILALALPFGLTACLKEVPLIPAGATQTITVSPKGEMSMSYSGRFYYPYEEYMQTMQVVAALMDKSGRGGAGDALKGEPDRAKAERVLALQLRHDFPEHKLVNRGDGYFDMTLPETTAVPLFGPNSTMLIGTGNRYGLMVEIAADASFERRMNQFDLDSPKPVLKIVERTLKNHLRGELVVRTQGRVDQHNADRVRKASDGFTEYVWAVRGEIRKPSMVIDLKHYSEKELNLRSASPGTSCMELIGELCKCGPFQLIQSNGQPIVNKPVVIRTDTMEVKRCSDAKGLVEALRLDFTSRLCTAIVENSNQPCR